MIKILLNNYSIQAINFKKLYTVEDKVMIIFDFTVTHEEYHDITTLLYKNDFKVNVPDENLSFSATIYNYFTSFTNLYEKGAVGDFHLELIEKEE